MLALHSRHPPTTRLYIQLFILPKPHWEYDQVKFESNREGRNTLVSLHDPSVKLSLIGSSAATCLFSIRSYDLADYGDLLQNDDRFDMG